MTAVELDHVTKRYHSTVAVNNVSLRIAKGETVGLVGESGSGKTTIAHMICGLEEPTSGAIRVAGQDAVNMSRRRRATHVSLVFQDTAGSLDPRYRVRDIVAEPLMVAGMSKDAATKKVVAVLASVGLDTEYILRMPHELSGGQRQRVGIARALVNEPELVVLDEPTSALDSYTRDEVLAVLTTLQSELSTAFLLISHDVNMVQSVSHRIVMIKDGEIT